MSRKEPNGCFKCGGTSFNSPYGEANLDFVTKKPYYCYIECRQCGAINNAREVLGEDARRG